MSKNYLKEERVIVKFLPNMRNGVTDKFHPLYGGMSSNASIAIPAPVLRKKIDKIFTKDELVFLGKELNEDLSPNSTFWREYRSDAAGMGVTGEFPIFLKKEGMMLNKNNALDYIKIKILEDAPLVASSPKEVKNNSAQYRFVLIKQNEMHTEDLEHISYKKQAYKHYIKFEDDEPVLRYVLKSFNRNVSYGSNLDFLQKETWKLVETVPQLFVKTIQDPLLETKILLDELVRYKLVNRSNKLYYLSNGDPIRLDDGTNDYDGAAEFLDSGAGQEAKLELGAKLKVLKK